MIVLKQGEYIQAKLSAVSSGGIKSVTLNAAGTGYTPGTVTLTVVQSGGASGTISATASAGGIITSLDSISAYGTGYSIETALETTAGAGTGCKVDITAIYQPSYSCSYVDTDDIPGQTSGYLNGTTAVTILSAPATGQRMLDLGIIFNSDKASITPIIELVSGGNTVEIVPRNALATNKTLHFGRQALNELSLDDTPVNGELTEGITSNWAYDHNAAETGVHGAGENDLVNTGDFGSNVGTFLKTPSSANLASAVTDETGTGGLVFANSPTLVTPVLGAATATSIQVGGESDYLSVGATGLVTMTGGGIGELNLRPNLVQSQSKVSSNTPTEITRGCNIGHSFPIWNSDTEELYFRQRIPARWDGTTDPQMGIMCTLMGAEDIGDKFRFQLEWQTTICGGDTVMGTTTSSCVSEQTVIDGGTAQYTAYCLWFTLDASDATNPIAVGEMLQGRLRRIAASSSDVTAEIGVWDWVTTWAVNKLYPVWSVESNVS